MERPICWILKICFFLWVSGLGSLEGQSFNPWANKEGREEMILIHEGQEAKAIEHYEDRLASDSDRQEALFGLTVAHARLGHPDDSISFLDRALESGLPFERFLAGPRDLLQPLYTFDAFQKRKARWIPALLHGPMVGGLTDRSARFWVRTSQSSRVEVLLRADGERFSKRPLITPEIWTQPSTDHTAVMEIHGLKPGQKYHYQVRMDGAIVSDGHAFMTFPRMHRPSDFTVAFGEVLPTPLNSNASLPPSKAGNLLRSSNWVTISMWINRKNHLSSATVTTGDRVPPLTAHWFPM